MQRLVSMLGEVADTSVKDKIIGVSHVNCEKDAIILSEEKKCYKPDNPVIISEMSATIGTYAGESGLMINI